MYYIANKEVLKNLKTVLDKAIELEKKPAEIREKRLKADDLEKELAAIEHAKKSNTEKLCYELMVYIKCVSSVWKKYLAPVPDHIYSEDEFVNEFVNGIYKSIVPYFSENGFNSLLLHINQICKCRAIDSCRKRGLYSQETWRKISETKRMAEAGEISDYEAVIREETIRLNSRYNTCSMEELCESGINISDAGGEDKSTKQGKNEDGLDIVLNCTNLFHGFVFLSSIVSSMVSGATYQDIAESIRSEHLVDYIDEVLNDFNLLCHSMSLHIESDILSYSERVLNDINNWKINSKFDSNKVSTIVNRMREKTNAEMKKINAEIKKAVA